MKYFNKFKLLTGRVSGARLIIASFIVLLGIFMGALGGIVVNAADQEANILDSLKDAITAPFRASNQNLTPDKESDVPLYRPALDYERAVIRAVKKASPAVVSIVISKQVPIIESCRREDPFSGLPPEFREVFDDSEFNFSVPCQTGTRLEEVGGGSGFIISSDGLIVTNKHVVSDTKASYTVFTNSGNRYDARILARDPVQDLAIIKISGNNLPTVELGDSDSIELGQTAIAIGNALAEFRNTVSVGVISGLSRTIVADAPGFSPQTITGLIQSDAAINLGNSGGPLINLRGEVIGINTAVASGAQNIGFAIPINDAKRDIDSVKAIGEIRVPYIGVQYILLSDAIAQAEDLPVSRGAWIISSGDLPAIISGSPADKVGLKEGDIITKINNIEVTNTESISDILSNFSIGESVSITFLRDGNEEIVSVVLDEFPTDL